jgi:hypothetical protein
MKKSYIITLSLIMTMALSSCFFDKKEEGKQDNNYKNQEQTNS